MSWDSSTKFKFKFEKGFTGFNGLRGCNSTVPQKSLLCVSDAMRSLWGSTTSQGMQA